MGLGNMWESFKAKRVAQQMEEEKRRQEEENLRQEVLKEIQPEMRQIKKEQIKQEELAKAHVEAKPKDKMAGLKMLADEFKGANLGTNDQMEKMLGSRGTPQGPQRGSSDVLTNDKIGDLLSSSRKTEGKDYGKLMGGHAVKTDRDIPGELGSGHKFRGDYQEVVGGTSDKDFSKLIGGSSLAPDEKVKRMIGRK